MLSSTTGPTARLEEREADSVLTPSNYESSAAKRPVESLGRPFSAIDAAVTKASDVRPADAGQSHPARRSESGSTQEPRSGAPLRVSR